MYRNGLSSQLSSPAVLRGVVGGEGGVEPDILLMRRRVKGPLAVTAEISFVTSMFSSNAFRLL